MNNYKYHYHFATFDLEIYDLENFRYNFVNLTAFRVVDMENVAVQRILRDMEKFQPKNQPILNKTNVIRVSKFGESLAEADVYFGSSNPLSYSIRCTCSPEVSIRWNVAQLCSR